MRKILLGMFLGILICQWIIIYQVKEVKTMVSEASVQTVVIEKEVVVEEEETEVLMEMSLPDIEDNSFKAYMDWRTITDTSSVQWAMQQEAETDENGFRRYNGYYMIAVGSYYSSKCGDILEIGFDNGYVIKCVVGDLKQDVHTDENNQYAEVDDGIGNVLEFIVDCQVMDEGVLTMGDVSYSVEELEGHIVSIVKVVE